MSLSFPQIWVLNGPNLNLLGGREPEIYGTATLTEIKEDCHQFAKNSGFSLDFRQTNHEGILIDWVQEAGRLAHGLLINGGGLTHTSVSLHDALKAIQIPKIEVHLTNPPARESFRHQSYISPTVHGVVAGFGRKSYILALEALITIYLKNT
jgi:3-dehydroquinate dehydratase II